MVRVPRIEDIEFAIKLYYSQPQIGNQDIHELFPKSGKNTVLYITDVLKRSVQSLPPLI